MPIRAVFITLTQATRASGRLFNIRFTCRKIACDSGSISGERSTATNTIGARQLRVRWTDPEYRAGQNAFYYVRVIEIPTPRWSTYDAVRFGVERPA